MSQNRFAAGLVIGVVCAWLAVQIPSTSAAPAQVAAGGLRYQVSAWAYPTAAVPGLSTKAQHGAYIVDTQTGVVWLVEGRDGPVNIGVVTR